MPVLIYLLVAAGVALVLYFAFRGPLSAFLKFRGPMVITCPENTRPAGVKVDARRAAFSNRQAPDFRLTYCSRWPERQDCGRACLKEIEAAPENCLVHHILTRWYEGKQCAICAKPVSDINWQQRRPAVLVSGGESMEWQEIHPEDIPAVLATGRPLCWTCHVAETFRRERAQLVVDRNFKRAAAK